MFPRQQRNIIWRWCAPRLEAWQKDVDCGDVCRVPAPPNLYQLDCCWWGNHWRQALDLVNWAFQLNRFPLFCHLGIQLLLSCDDLWWVHGLEAWCSVAKRAVSGSWSVCAIRAAGCGGYSCCPCMTGSCVFQLLFLFAIFFSWNQTTTPFVSPHCKCCVVSDLQFRFAVALATGNCFYLPTTYSMSSLCLYPPYIEFNILHASSPSLRVRHYLWEELQSFGGFKFQHPKWRPPHTQT